MYTESNSFKKGVEDVKHRYRRDIRDELKKVLGIVSDVQYYKRMRGEVDHTPAERIGIETVFAKYGVKRPWGKE